MLWSRLAGMAPDDVIRLALHLCVRLGLTHAAEPLVALLLARPGVDAAAIGPEGRTALAEASAAGSTAAVESLLAAGADPAACGEGGQSALEAAAGTGHGPVLDILLGRAAPGDASSPGGAGFRAVLAAVSGGHPAAVARLVGAGAGRFHPDGAPSALVAAAERDDTASARALLGLGGDGSAGEPWPGRASELAAALRAAAGAGSEGVARALLAAGADPAPGEDGGDSAVMAAARGTGSGVITILVRERGQDPRALSPDGLSPMQVAAAAGNAAAMAELLALGVDPNHGGIRAPVILAAAAGHNEVAELLVDREFHASTGKSGIIPLLCAVREDRTDIVRLLTGGEAGGAAAGAGKPGEAAPGGGEAGFSVNYRKHGKWCLIAAARKGRPDVIHRFLGDLDALGSAVDEAHASLAHMAVAGANDSTLEAIIACSAPLGLFSDAGDTPFLLACRLGRGRAVELLLKAGVDTSQVDAKGLSGLDLALSLRHLECLKPMLEGGLDLSSARVPGEGGSYLHKAAADGDAELAGLIASHGSPDVRSGSGLTAAHIAAREGHLDVLRALGAAGADLNARAGTADSPPLQYVAGGGEASLALLEVLVELGADVDARINGMGQTLLHAAAAAAGDVGLVDALLAAGASRTLVDRQGACAARLACVGGKPELLPRLLPGRSEPRSDAAIADALAFALGSDDASLLPAVLRPGAEGEEPAPELGPRAREALNAADGDGRTGLCRAVEAGDEETARLLLESGADRSAGHAGACLVTLALGQGRPELAESLFPAEATTEGLDARRRLLAAATASPDDALLGLVLHFGKAADADADADAVPSPGSLAALLGEKVEAGGTALHAAVESRSDDVVRSMVSLGPDLSVTDGSGRPPAELAAEKGRLDLVADLLPRGEGAAAVGARAAVIRRALDADTPALFWLLLRDELVPGLAVEARGLIGTPGRSGLTALHRSVGGEWAGAHERLLRLGAPRTALDDAGRSPVLAACLEGRLDLVRELMPREGGDASSAVRRSVVAHAAGRGKPDLTRILAGLEPGSADPSLLASGGELDEAGEDGRTVLRAAVESGDADLARALLAAGADRLAADADGTTCADAAERSSDDAIRALFSRAEPGKEEDEEAEEDSSHPATAECAARMAEAALADMMALTDAMGRADGPGPGQHRPPPGGGPPFGPEGGPAGHVAPLGGSPIDRPGPGGLTKLYDAAARGETAEAEAILAEGASLSRQSGASGTAIAGAIAGGHLDTLDVLLRAVGAREAAEQPDVMGRSALAAAVLAGRAEALVKLLAVGVSPDPGALILAAKRGSESSVAAMLEASGGGPLVDRGDDYGRTALWWAARRGHGSVVGALLRAGADVSIETEQYGGPLDAALDGGHPDVAALLSAPRASA